MPIPESQLETWTHQGAITTAQATHVSIRAALDAYKGWPANIDREVYLQGSYRNSTNIRGDSDVDLVVQLNSTFGYNLNQLPPDQQKLFHAAFPTNATYGWSNFRAHTLRALQDYYGAGAITEGNKALNIAAGQGRLSAHVVPALHYRDYLFFRGHNDNRYVEGIRFHAGADNRAIANYPKPHFDNGAAKNKRAAERYKPAVRLFKNMRTHLVGHRTIANTLAPSYFIECLLYNVPDDRFAGTWQQAFAGIVNYLHETTFDKFVCQNERIWLFGTTPEQWVQNDAKTFIQSVINLWHQW